MGILLGYSEVGYRVLLDRKIVVARHVDIVEDDVKCIGLDLDENETDYTLPSTPTFGESRMKNNDNDDNPDDNVFESADESEKPNDKIKVGHNKDQGLRIPRRSERERKSTVRYPEPETYNIFVNYSRVDTPCTFEEAMNSKDSKNWQEAMDKEIDCINKNKTWSLVDKKERKKY